MLKAGGAFEADSHLERKVSEGPWGQHPSPSGRAHAGCLKPEVGTELLSSRKKSKQNSAPWVRYSMNVLPGEEGVQPGTSTGNDL